MKAPASTPEVSDSTLDRDGIGGHPRGLTTLFFTEMWERFSYYGMRAMLLLYMTTAVASGGLGFDTKTATSIYGAYVGSVYLMSIPGGWIADNVLGTRNAVFVGGVLIALGHYSLFVPTTLTFYAGLIFIVLGTGLLKPNVSAVVGSLYSETDQRRDAGFSIFYMGINLGAFWGPIVCGSLRRSYGWHVGFGMAGVGMTLGLIQYVLGRNRLAHVGHPPIQSSEQTKRKALTGVLFLAAISLVVVGLYFGPDYIRTPLAVLLIVAVIAGLIYLFGWYLKPEEKKPVLAIGVLFVFSVIFWAVFEQAGSSFTLFADRFTNRATPFYEYLPGFLQRFIGTEFTPEYYQSINSIFIFSLAPVAAWLWMKLGDRQPSSPAKFAFGLLFVGLGALLLTAASTLLDGGNKVGPWWLVGVYLLHTIGELCLSPVGLSTTTKLAPARLSGLMMGVWFLSISIGNFVAGWAAGFFEAGSVALVGLFSKVAAVPVIAAVILFALTPWIRRLMGKVR